MMFFRNHIPYHGWATRDFALNGYLDYGSIMRYKSLTKIGVKQSQDKFDQLFQHYFLNLCPNLNKVCNNEVLFYVHLEYLQIEELRKLSKMLKLADTTIHCDISNRGALFGLKMLMEDIEHFDRRIEQIDQEIQIYWDEIKNDLYFPTFPGIDMIKSVALYTEFGGLNRFSHPGKAEAFSGLENFVYISGESKNFNGRMIKAGSPIIRRMCWEILSPPKKYIPRLTEHMNKLKDKGKHHSACIHSASKKLIRILWALEHHKQEYVNPVYANGFYQVRRSNHKKSNRLEEEMTFRASVKRRTYLTIDKKDS